MYFRTTFIMAVIAVFLGLWVLFVESGLKNSSEAAVERVRLFPLLLKDAPTGIRIEGPNGKMEFRKRKDEDFWDMKLPVLDLANKDAVREILKAAQATKKIETRNPKELNGSAEDFGFGANAVTLSFFRGERLLEKAEFSLPLPGRSDMYAIKGEWGKSPVFVVYDDLRRLIDSKPDELRAPRVLPALPSDVRRFEFSEGNFTLQLERFPHSTSQDWVIRKPFETNADSEAVTAYLAHFLNMEVEEFIDNPGAEISAIFGSNANKRVKFILRERTGVLALEFAADPSDPNRLLVRLEEEQDRPQKLRGRRGIFVVDPGVLQNFVNSPNLVRDRFLGNIEKNAVTKIEIRAPFRGEVDNAVPGVVLERDEKNGYWWVRQNGEKVLANATKISRLIDTINREEVQFVLDGAFDARVMGLEPAIRSLAITSTFFVNDGSSPDAPPKQESVTRVLRFGIDRLAAWDDIPSLMQTRPGVDLTQEQEIPLEVSAWKSMQILNEPLQRVAEIIINRPQSPEVRVSFNPSGQGSLFGIKVGENDETRRIDPLKVNALFNRVCNLKAQRWVSDLPAVRDRLQDPSLEIEVKFRNLPNLDAPEPVKIRLSPIKDVFPLDSELFYGEIEGKGTFLIDLSTYFELQASLLLPKI